MSGCIREIARVCVKGVERERGSNRVHEFNRDQEGFVRELKMLLLYLLYARQHRKSYLST